MGLQTWLESPTVFTAVAASSAFTAYFSMYGVRKLWAGGEFEDKEALGLELKNGMGLFLTAGYALGKLLAIRVLPAISRQHRLKALSMVYITSLLSLLLFAFLPTGGQMLVMFLNGLPLAWVWGLIFVYLEGRHVSDILGAGLSFSYIVASGAVKSVGVLLLDNGVSEDWMPFVGGCVFIIPYLLACVVLDLLPPPSAEEVKVKCVRRPMTDQEQKEFMRFFGLGLGMLTLAYMLLTALRDFRELFSVEIWEELNGGEHVDSYVYLVTEIPVGIASLIPLTMLYYVKDDAKAFFYTQCFMFAGIVVTAGVNFLYDVGAVGDYVWMIGIGAGLYWAYVPYACVLFDRMMGAFKIEGTSVFVISVSDGAAYMGSFGVLLYNNFGVDDDEDEDEDDDDGGDDGTRYIDIMKTLAYMACALAALCYMCSVLYFRWLLANHAKTKKLALLSNDTAEESNAILTAPLLDKVGEDSDAPHEMSDSTRLLEKDPYGSRYSDEA